MPWLMIDDAVVLFLFSLREKRLGDEGFLIKT
jgi:hypothetical protein